MRPFSLASAVVLTLALTGCGSTVVGGAGGASASSTASGTLAPITPSRSITPSAPAPSPSGSGAITVSGAVPASVLSLTGPLALAGPFLGTSVSGLLNQMRTASGVHPLACLPAGCWRDAQVPPGNLLVAVRPTLISCFRMRSIHTSRPSPATVELDLELTGVCRPGQGMAARMPALLIALPTASLPKTGRLTVLARLSVIPGQPLQTLGSASIARP